MSAVLTILLSIVGSSAVFGFIQFMITRKDNKNEKLDKLSKDIGAVNSSVKALSETVDKKISDLSIEMKASDEKLRQENMKTVADTRRVRILRGSDEIKLKMRHSEEWFDQMNEDITEYEKYCESHPGYKNNKAVHAIANINSVYAKALDENDFL
jgi:outer membrane murein-binding lipoprotein Lpp